MKKETVTGRDRTLYRQMVSEAMPKKPMLPQLLKAFVVGGLICCIGQAVSDLGRTMLHLDEDALSAAYEALRKLTDGDRLVMQLHDADVEHHHGRAAHLHDATPFFLDFLGVAAKAVDGLHYQHVAGRHARQHE